MIEVKPITVRIEFPALDNLVDYLKAPRTSEQPKAEAPAKKPAKKAEPVKPVEEKSVPEEEPVKAEEPAVEEEPDIIEEQTEVGPNEKRYAPDEVAAMAMRLRDIDKANIMKVKDHFPELGIKSLGDIRNNDDACQKLAKILIGMGAND